MSETIEELTIRQMNKIGELTKQRDDLLAALENWFEWHANHFDDFDGEVNGQLLCLATETEAAIAKTVK